ncbi:MAG: hypothetical protein HKN47_17350 [Pirellulaceae bacterium]|nr:hypothetical protein [Pirellulaceae bacterium]
MNAAVRQHRSRWLLFALTLVALLITAVTMWQSAMASSRQLDEMREDLADAHRMTADIQRLKYAPRIASLEMESPDEISKRVTSALRKLKSSTVRLQRVDPQQPIRIAKTEYQMRATDVELENIQLHEMAQFVSEIVESGQGLEVRDIVLSLPRVASKATETWSARLTLTQVIFSPTRR